MTTTENIRGDLPVSSAKFKYLRQVLDTPGPFVDEAFEAGDMVRIIFFCCRGRITYAVPDSK